MRLKTGFDSLLIKWELPHLKINMLLNSYFFKDEATVVLLKVLKHIKYEITSCSHILTGQTSCLCFMFTLHVQTSCSHIVFTLRLQTSSSHCMFTLHVHTACSHFMSEWWCSHFMLTPPCALKLINPCSHL